MSKCYQCRAELPSNAHGLCDDCRMDDYLDSWFDFPVDQKVSVPPVPSVPVSEGSIPSVVFEPNMVWSAGFSNPDIKLPKGKIRKRIRPRK